MSRCHPLPNYYLFLVTIAILLLATSGGGVRQCHKDQSAALLRLKASLSFNLLSARKKLSSWKIDTNCCTWNRVTCDGKSGVVTALNLFSLGISGNLSSSGIFELTSLRSLSLAYNSFDSSPWPSPGFELLTDLEYLDLSDSGLYGDFHIEKGQLSNLATLILCGVDLKNFNLWTLIDNLGTLQKLYLCGFDISASPANLMHASSSNTTSGLRELSLVWCTITGSHFDTLLLFRSKLANLVVLKLVEFDLTDLSIHTLIDSLGGLQSLYLENLNILASPTDLGRSYSANTMSGLKELNIDSCTVTSGRLDTLLTKLPTLSNLVMLSLSGGDLKNLSLDILIDNLGSLQKLYLNSVNIEVSPTKSVLHHSPSTNTTPGLQELKMQGCTITGSIDTALAKFRYLSKLILDGTKIIGPALVLEHFKEFSSLTVLSLQSCGLTGTFPPWIFHIKSLVVLDVSGNENLRGELPEFINSSTFQVLKLNGTKFSGKMPISIGNLRNLVELDFSNCQFHGQMPAFTQWPMISSIDLSGNNLNGSLPYDGFF